MEIAVRPIATEAERLANCHPQEEIRVVLVVWEVWAGLVESVVPAVLVAQVDPEEPEVLGNLVASAVPEASGSPVESAIQEVSGGRANPVEWVE